MKNVIKLLLLVIIASSCATQSDRYVAQKNYGNPHYKGYNSKYPMRHHARCK
jgi:hypothetical protein